MSQHLSNPLKDDSHPERHAHRHFAEIDAGPSHSVRIPITPGISEGFSLSRELASYRLEDDRAAFKKDESMSDARVNEERIRVELKPGGSGMYHSSPSHGGPSNRNTSGVLHHLCDTSEDEFIRQYWLSESFHAVNDQCSKSNVGDGDLDVPQYRHESPEVESCAPSHVPRRPKFSAQAAEKILQNFGLEKEDTVHLISFPKEQLKISNLPNVMRQIREEKDRRRMAEIQSKFSLAPSTRSSLEGLSTPPLKATDKDERGPPLQPLSKIFDYGHQRKYDGPGEDFETDVGISEGDNKPRMDSAERGHTLLNYVSVLRCLSEPSSPVSVSADLLAPQAPFLSSNVKPKTFGVVLSDGEKECSEREQLPVKGLFSQLETEPLARQQEKLQKKQEPQLNQNPEVSSHITVSQPQFVSRVSAPSPPAQSGTSEMHAASAEEHSKWLPTTAMMQDCLAFLPRVFPRTCSLCINECASASEWISHQRSDVHTESCKTLYQKYPAWDGTLAGPYSDASKDAKPPPTSPCPKSSGLERSRSPQRRKRSPSLSASSSRDSSSSSSSSSGSPAYRRRRRSSPDRRMDRRYSSSHYRERRYSPSRSGDRWFSGSRGRERHSSPRRIRGRSPLKRSRDRTSSPRRGQERLSSPRRKEYARRRSPNKRSPLRRSRDRRSLSNSSVESVRSPDTTSPLIGSKDQSAESLVKKLLEKSAGHLISNESTLDAVVKTLVPVLLAKMKTMKPTSGTKESSSAASSSTAKQDKALSSAEVTLGSVHKAHSHDRVMSAMQQFGKVKSLVLHRSRQEAVVCFDSVDISKLQDEKLYKTLQFPFTMKEIISSKTVTTTEKLQSNVEMDVKPDEHPSAAAGLQTAEGGKKPTRQSTLKSMPGEGPLNIDGGTAQRGAMVASSTSTSVSSLNSERPEDSGSGETADKSKEEGTTGDQSDESGPLIPSEIEKKDDSKSTPVVYDVKMQHPSPVCTVAGVHGPQRQWKGDELEEIAKTVLPPNVNPSLFVKTWSTMCCKYKPTGSEMKMLLNMITTQGHHSKWDIFWKNSEDAPLQTSNRQMVSDWADEGYQELVRSVCRFAEETWQHCNGMQDCLNMRQGNLAVCQFLGDFKTAYEAVFERGEVGEVPMSKYERALVTSAMQRLGSDVRKKIVAHTEGWQNLNWQQLCEHAARWDVPTGKPQRTAFIVGGGKLMKKKGGAR